MGTEFASNTRRIGRDDRQSWSRDFAAIAAGFKHALASVAELVPNAQPQEGVDVDDRYLTALGEHADAVIEMSLREMHRDAVNLSQDQLSRLCLAVVTLQQVRFRQRQAILEEQLHVLQVAQQLASDVPDEIGVDALLEYAAASICKLPGLNRSMVFRRDGSVLRAAATYFTGKDEWARECQAYSVNTPYALGPRRPEAEIIRRRVPAIVTDAMHDPNAFAPIVNKIETESYVVAPVVAYGEVVATLHGDAYFDRRAVDEADRDALAAFATTLGRTLERALVIERLRTQQAAAEQLARSASIAVRGLVQLPPSSAPVVARPSVEWMGSNHAMDDLTQREKEVLQLIIKGATNIEIARHLFVSEDTVKSRVKRILRKLGASNRGQAVAIYLDTLAQNT